MMASPTCPYFKHTHLNMKEDPQNQQIMDYVAWYGNTKLVFTIMDLSRLSRNGNRGAPFWHFSTEMRNLLFPCLLPVIFH